jgi:cellobiose phosphorylase
MGAYLFLRDVSTGDWWSATAEPKTAPGEQVQALFNDDKASFTKVVGSLRTEVECIVISEGNGEGRRVTLINEGDTDRHIEVTSFAELVLSHPDNDNAHPAFRKCSSKRRLRQTTARSSRIAASGPKASRISVSPISSPIRQARPATARRRRIAAPLSVVAAPS